MRLCHFPGCERFPHSSSVYHARWDESRAECVPLAEQRTPAERMRERRAQINREKAEKIARRVADEAWHEEPGDITGPEKSARYNLRLNAARAAARAVLIEKGN